MVKKYNFHEMQNAINRYSTKVAISKHFDINRPMLDRWYKQYERDLDLIESVLPPSRNKDIEELNLLITHILNMAMVCSKEALWGLDDKDHDTRLENVIPNGRKILHGTWLEMIGIPASINHLEKKISSSSSEKDIAQMREEIKELEWALREVKQKNRNRSYLKASQ